MPPRSPRVRIKPQVLKAWRKERDLTQFALAQLVGCSDTLIALIETGRRQPSYENALAMAEAFGIDLEVLADVDEVVVEAGFVTAPTAAYVAFVLVVLYAIAWFVHAATAELGPLGGAL